MKNTKPKSIAAKPNYQPTAPEQTALRNFDVRRSAKTAPRIKVLRDCKAARIAPDHPNEAIGYKLLMEALGTVDVDFFNGLLNQLANVGSHGAQVDEDQLNFMLSIVKGFKPNDQLEAMLAAQMAAVHLASMTFARRVQHVDNIAQQDSAERALNKLMRTFTTQIEALKRYRTGGEQKVTVQHVSVSEGGQAIVGNVTQAAHDTATKKPANLTPALTHEQKPAMTTIGKPEREPVVVRHRLKDGGQSST